ncbi:DUF6404 family protein, partial [Serratia marcescens]
YKKLWKYGVQIPPPPFCPFWLNTLTFGFFFGMAWGGVMFVLTISISSFSNGVILYYSILAGLLFGLVMAAFHRWRKTVNRLPDWDDL